MENYGDSDGRNNKQHTYKGECAALGDNVCTYNDASQADRCSKTTDSLMKHIQREHTRGQDVVDALEKGKPLDPNSCKPKDNSKPGAETRSSPHKLSSLEEMMLAGEVKNYFFRKEKYEDNMNKAYGLILGQCTQGVKNKLETEKVWDAIHASHDPIELLKLIKQVTLNYQDSKYTYKSIFHSMTAFHTLKQHADESLIAYLKRFKIAQDLMELHHGKLQMTSHIKNHPDYRSDGSNEDDLTKIAYKRYVAYTFIQGLDPQWYGNLAIELDNLWVMGNGR